MPETAAGWRSQPERTKVAKHSEYYVEKRQDDGNWVVKLPHAERVNAIRSAQQAAIERAKELAPEGVIHVKQTNGKFREVRWVEMWQSVTGPKNHHYVPRFILCQFLADPDKEQVAVYDKHTNSGFVTSIDNIMAENHFHVFEFEEWTISFEPIATQIEQMLVPTYRRILHTRQLDRTPREKSDLALLLAFQFVRTKAARSRYRDLATALAAKIEASGQRLEDLPGWEPLTNETQRRHEIITMRDSIPEFAKSRNEGLLFGRTCVWTKLLPGR
jgi:hypothetical protein